jgi:hypothetical protein
MQNIYRIVQIHRNDNFYFRLDKRIDLKIFGFVFKLYWNTKLNEKNVQKRKKNFFNRKITIIVTTQKIERKFTLLQTAVEHLHQVERTEKELEEIKNFRKKDKKLSQMKLMNTNKSMKLIYQTPKTK